MSRPKILFGFAISVALLLGCTARPSVPTLTGQPTVIFHTITAGQVETPSLTATPRATAVPTATVLPTTTMIASATPNSTLTPTASPTPWPTLTAIDCGESAARLEKPFPDTLDLQNSRTFFDGNFVYLATQNYVGLVDISLPAFYGFWELPQPDRITDILVYNGAIYASSGTTVYVLNPNSECRLSVITQLEVPFNASRMEVDGDRLYVSGTNDQQNKEQLAIFTNQSPEYQEQIGLLNLGEKGVTWSVQHNEVFLLDHVVLKVIDVSVPMEPVERPVNFTLDEEEFGKTLPPEMIDNSLYYFSFVDGQNAIHQLDQAAPIVQVTQKEYALDSVTRAVTDLMQIDRDYIFLGVNWCDVDCSSSVNIISRATFEPLVRTGLQPNYPVHAYVEITKDLVYAFSDDQLLVIDISDPDHPSIVQTIPLTI